MNKKSTKKQELKFQCRNLNQSTFEKAVKLKEELNLTYGGLIEFLINEYESKFESGYSRRQKVEIAIKKMLVKGVEPINHTTLRTATKSRSQMIGEIMRMDAYREDIRKHNDSLRKK